MTEPSGAVTVEPLRWWHLPAVHELERALFPDDPWSPEQFWAELAQPTRRYVVALAAGGAAAGGAAAAGGVVAGYAGLFLLPPDADIQTVGVAPGRQGCGIGRRLVEHLLADADAAGATHTMLEVRADNAPALGLYASLGFVPISERRRYYPDGGDAVIMRRPRPCSTGGVDVG